MKWRIRLAPAADGSFSHFLPATSLPKRRATADLPPPPSKSSGVASLMMMIDPNAIYDAHWSPHLFVRPCWLANALAPPFDRRGRSIGCRRRCCCRPAARNRQTPVPWPLLLYIAMIWIFSLFPLSLLALLLRSNYFPNESALSALSFFAGRCYSAGRNDVPSVAPFNDGQTR